MFNVKHLFYILCICPDFVLKKFKSKDKGLALREKDMNRIINCKCSEMRRMAANKVGVPNEGDFQNA